MFPCRRLSLDAVVNDDTEVSPHPLWTRPSTNPQGNPHDRPETAEAQRFRLAREVEMIAEARASAAAGRVVSLEAVEAWVDSWDTDHEMPMPRSAR